MHGRVAGISRNPLGDEASAAASIGATTVYVDDGTDFDEDGGSVLIGGTVYDYLSVDYIGDSADEGDLAVLTLATPLLAAVAEGDRVDVWDSALGEVAVEHIATLVPDSAVPGDPLEADVDHRLVPLLAEGIRASGSESVELERDGDDLRVVTILGKSAEFNDTPLATAQPPGERVVIRNDGSGGIIEFFSDLIDGAYPTPSTIDPTNSAGRPGVEITTGTTAAYSHPATIRLGSRYNTDPGDHGYVDFLARVQVFDDLQVWEGLHIMFGGLVIDFGGLTVDGGGITVTGGATISGGATITGPVELNTLDGSGGLSYVMVGNDGVLSRGDTASSLEARLDAIEARLTAGGL